MVAMVLAADASVRARIMDGFSVAAGQHRGFVMQRNDGLGMHMEHVHSKHYAKSMSEGVEADATLLFCLLLAQP